MLLTTVTLIKKTRGRNAVMWGGVGYAKQRTGTRGGVAYNVDARGDNGKRDKEEDVP